MRPDACRGGNRSRRRYPIRRHTDRHGCRASSAGSGSRRSRPARSDRWWCAKYAGAWRFPQSGQILPGDDFAEARIIRDELLDELVHAVLENVVHVAVLEPVADAAGMALRRTLATIGDADLVEVAHEVAIAARERTRQRIVEDEQVRDQPGF